MVSTNMPAYKINKVINMGIQLLMNDSEGLILLSIAYFMTKVEYWGRVNLVMGRLGISAIILFFFFSLFLPFF
tara:strand:+ start:694 stop:912 length:219 start_codon:yes stop_codon:yes gene_type:complete